MSIIEGERVQYNSLAMSLGTMGLMLGAHRGVVQQGTCEWGSPGLWLCGFPSTECKSALCGSMVPPHDRGQPVGICRHGLHVCLYSMCTLHSFCTDGKSVRNTSNYNTVVGVSGTEWWHAAGHKGQYAGDTSIGSMRVGEVQDEQGVDFGVAMIQCMRYKLSVLQC